MNAEQRSRVTLSNPAHFLALGAGSGLASKMPGTFGTLAAVPLVCLLLETVSLNVYLFLCLIASVAGIWICGKTADDMGVHDDSSIVWDEVAGMMITMIAVPLSWQTMLVGFVLFRVFDILKPWPISYLDKHVHGGFGIMADDVLAGIAAFASLHLLLHFGVL
ncbi:phosphatidylglycerophosphatase A [Aliiglaciecola sp. 2_MG-2023]|uniref:phosphatidylglycerophosphatase A family protein n=1 Tax=Alteromonadaceae TaxID=72275 RepID=UPI0026E14E58|nr:MULTISPECIES: phosphatidylglycerophosphatase A [unclassified Aliiglaciecola]MDO6709943.1 phosphatidylglycerophosphatase A [Aliiglaciecola sp. 2_MG-2023]MDO6751091.1 phosphatidylglycerophosphatase A [Aliiglaciecola sp. 1_MG-2023]